MTLPAGVGPRTSKHWADGARGWCTGGQADHGQIIKCRGSDPKDVVVHPCGLKEQLGRNMVTGNR